MASFTADDTYDRADVYAEVAAQYPHADVVLPPRSGAVPGDTRTDDGRQVTEVTTAADAPNRMPGLGRPEHVRVA